MFKTFNLIMSTYAMREYSALHELLSYIGYEDVRISVIKRQRSLMLLKVYKLSPYTLIDVVRDKVDPVRTSILRIIPVDEVIEALVDKVAEYVWSVYEDKIKDYEKYRITLEGHLFWLKEGIKIRAGSREAIDFIAKGIKRKVNLKEPDKIVFIKVVNLYNVDYACVTICEPKYIFSTQKIVKSKV